MGELDLVCVVCDARPTEGNKLFKCARCRSVVYCCRDHQKAHWKEHRKTCEAPVECAVCFEKRPPVKPYTCSHSLCAACVPKSRECPLCRAPFGVDDPSALPPLPDVSSDSVVEPGAWRGGDPRSSRPKAMNVHDIETNIYDHGLKMTDAERKIWNRSLKNGGHALAGHDACGWTRMHTLAATTVRDVRATMDYIEVFAEAGLDVNARTAPGPAGHTNSAPAHMAAMHDNAAILVKLHELGADMRLKTSAGRSPIVVAAAGGCLRSVFALARLVPARGVVFQDDAGGAQNIADVLAASIAKHSRRPGRFATRDRATWEKAWAWATSLAPPLQTDSEATFREFLPQIDNPNTAARPFSGRVPDAAEGCPVS